MPERLIRLSLPEQPQPTSQGGEGSIPQRHNAYLGGSSTVERAKQLDPAEIADGTHDVDMEDPHFRNMIYRRMSIAAERSRMEGSDYTIAEKAMFKRVFARFDLTPQEGGTIWSGWNSYISTYSMPVGSRVPEDKTLRDHDPARLHRYTRQIWDNLTAMDYIHSRNSQGVKQLFDHDGIRHFGRYNRQLLLEQSLDNRKPEQVSLAGVVDWGNSAARMHDKLKMMNADKPSRRIRVLEAATAEEAGMRLDAIAKEHGPIKDLVITAHSDAHSLEMGRGPKGVIGVNNVRNTKDKRGMFGRKTIAKNADITILGCKTATSGGIAHEIAEATGARVHAADDLVTGVRRTTDGLVEFSTHGGEVKPAIVFSPNPTRLSHIIRHFRRNR